ncbi:augmin complex subunit dgt4 [Drosophila hydei]|uniref:Augmin complex subunit dgt4 n=1 Tax=Drosophila hydei TaxID=7224 RepID=A0A6J1LHP0_DROHY|nr:augmin complex subunit dgt4 [Drosophila hydei]
MTTENNTSNGLEDIQYLLHLESLKRYTEQAKNMHRQAEEHARHFVDAKREYQREYTSLVNLSKHVDLREILEAKSTEIAAAQVSSLPAQLDGISAALSNDRRPTEFDVQTLEECKQQLQSNHRPRTKLTNQHKFTKNREAFKTLHTMIKSVENGFQLSTLAAMDQMIIDPQRPNQ